MAGRGFGKTKAGAEWVRHLAETKQAKRIALMAPTAAAIRNVMIEGQSGILAVCPPWFRPVYSPSIQRLIWPNGVIAACYSADEPERLHPLRPMMQQHSDRRRPAPLGEPGSIISPTSAFRTMCPRPRRPALAAAAQKHASAKTSHANSILSRRGWR